MGQEPRQSTSNVGHINKPSIQVNLTRLVYCPLTPCWQALIHGLNRHYYSIGINFRKTELEQAMLLNLHKTNWTEGLKLQNFEEHKHVNEKAIGVRVTLA
jgi:26S proteasome regulatory subunit N11